MTRSSMPAGRVVVLGSVNLDYVLRLARRPEPGETVADATLEIHPGGKGANQAVAAARSGAAVAMIARVGADPGGAERLAELRREKVDTGHVTVSAEAPTGVAFITVTAEGENAIVVAPGANAELSPAHLDAAAPAVERADVLVAQLEIPLPAVERAAEIAGPRASLVLNAAPYRPLPPALLSRVDLLVVNETEAAAMSGLPLAGVDEAAATARALRALGCSSVVVTLGRAGAVVAGVDFEGHVPSPPAHVVDTTGAGDAFVGALAARLAAGEGIEEAVRFAVAVGSATTERRGAGAVVPAGAQGRQRPE